MSAVDKIESVRARLTAELEREPLTTEVAKALGVSRERVRQLYVLRGWDTRAGRRAQRDASGHTHTCNARAERTAARVKRNVEIIERLERGEAYMSIAEQMGIKIHIARVVGLDAGYRERKRRKGLA